MPALHPVQNPLGYSDISNNTPCFMLKDLPTTYNIPAGVSFADCLAQGILDQYQHQPEIFAKMTVFLPSKRGIRTLREAFLKRVQGKILLLPKIRSLGDAMDDEMSLLPDDAASPYAVLGQKRPINSGLRQLVLTRLILDHIPAYSTDHMGYSEAFSLSATLLELMDSLQSERIPIEALHDIYVEDYAENWQANLEIAIKVTSLWPKYLSEHGFCDPIVYRNLILEYLTDFWEKNPPDAPVIAAGSTGSMPASADFMKLIGQLPQGCVVLPGLDPHLTSDDIAGLHADHPQYGLYTLVKKFGQDPHKIPNWHSVDKFLNSRHLVRQRLCHEVMRPAGTAEAWFNVTERLSAQDISEAIEDIKLIHAPNDRKEASAIALIIREALETPHKTVALITPNRILAQRVKAMLSRWDILPNDSAGVPLSDLPQGVYFKLLCDVLEQNFAPIPLMAFLKHPFSNAGLPKGEFKAQVRRFEQHVLRGMAPKNGLMGYRIALEEKVEKNTHYPDKAETYQPSLNLLTYLERLFAPMQSLDNQTNMADFIHSFIDLVEEFSCTDTQNANELFWNNDAGRAAEELLTSFSEASEILGSMNKTAIYRHIKEFSAKVAVRPAFGYDPNIVIWGTQEARLQQTDIVIMAGLTEGSWPIAPDTGVWLSRPMRIQLGLTPPERRIGLSSHDFVQALCGTKIYLTHSAESNGAPNIPSRWIIRLENLLKGAFPKDNMLEKLHDSPYLNWVDQLDATHVVPKPAKCPAPTPPIATRPMEMSVTDAEKLIRDPYAIYGKYILGIRKLAAIDEEMDKSEKGTIIHQLFYDFVSQMQSEGQKNPHEIMKNLVSECKERLKDRPTMHVFWGRKLDIIGEHFVEFELARRKSLKPIMIEQKGEISFMTSNGPFTLKARCDRIDVTADNHAVIVDYKTSANSASTYEQVKSGFAPQLPLQAMMIKQGGFGSSYQIQGGQYIIVTDSKIPPFEIKSIEPKKKNASDPPFAELIGDVYIKFQQLIENYNDEKTPYISRKFPEMLKYDGDYDLLARVPEWSLSEDEDEAA